MKLMGNNIRGKLLPLPEKHGILWAAPAQYRNHGRTGVNFEPVRVEVLDIGPGVKYVNVGDIIVLSNRRFTEYGEDEVLFGERMHGCYYWTKNGKQINTHTEQEEIKKASDLDVIEGNILYSETTDKEQNGKRQSNKASTT